MKKPQITNKISFILILSIVSTVSLLGLYFDSFLEDNYIEKSKKQMQHAYNRFDIDINSIKKELTEGISFIETDEPFIASVNLINNYQDKQNYNSILLDEEKKIIADELLHRVKLSFNDDIAIYDKNEELVSFVIKEDNQYQLNFFSYKNGEQILYTKYENEKDYKLKTYEKNKIITFKHEYYYDKEVSNKSFITFHLYKDEVFIKSHKSIYENKKVLAHMEMSNKIGNDYFKELSKDLGIKIFLSNNKKYNIDKLKIVQTKNSFFSAKILKVEGDEIYVVAEIDNTPLKIALNETRTKLILFSIIIILIMYILLYFFFKKSITNPLEKLMLQIDKIEDGDYSNVKTISSGDEFEMISKNMNDLAAAVEQREVSLKESHKQLDYLSNHDILTGLANRRLFSLSIKHALEIAKRNKTQLAIIFIDLDEFKQVNDLLGHDIGDELLKSVAQRLNSTVRESDIIARIGGDEFNILIENFDDIKDVKIIADKIIDDFVQPFEFREHSLKITTSMGIAIYPEDGEDSISLIKNADLAMYKSKDSGRNNYSFFSSELSQNLKKRIEYTNSLKYAIDSGDEFSLVYQPKISLKTQKIVAVEALIRWNSTKLGFISPDQFISLAEDTNLIIPIGKWVLTQACSDFVKLQNDGLELEQISINVSGVQLQNSDMIQTVKEVIKETQMDPRKMELEITESYIATHEQNAIEVLQQLRDMGIDLAIDDFGTGYSSMSYLQKLPVTRLKIDKSFIDNIEVSYEGEALVKAIIVLAKTFNLSITAEGVENENQVDFLKKERCDEIQGYYYSKPLKLDELRKFMGTNS